MNENKVTVDDQFYDKISEYLKDGAELNTKAIYDIFPEFNQKTISWRLYKLVQQGKLFKAGHGYYSLNENTNHIASGYDYLQTLSKNIYDEAIQYGYKFYITGLDALVGEILHIPENFPALMVVEEAEIDNMDEVLSDLGYFVLTELEKNIFQTQILRGKVEVIILKGKDFSLATDNIANKEKGFIDLYYAVTRCNYNFAIAELSRIYDSMKRNETVTTLKMKEAAKDRRLDKELMWLHEVKGMPPKAKEFMKYRLNKETI